MIDLLIKVFIVLLLLVIGCKEDISTRIEENIVAKLKNNENREIKLSDFTNFTWDTVYFFSGYSSSSIKEYLGRDDADILSSLDSDMKLMVFVSKSRIIYQEKYNIILQFRELYKDQKIPTYTPDNAIFMFNKEETYQKSGEYFYDLYPK